MSGSPWKRPHEARPQAKRSIGDSLLAFLVLVTMILGGLAFLAWQIVLPVIGLLWIGGAI